MSLQLVRAASQRRGTSNIQNGLEWAYFVKDGIAHIAGGSSDSLGDVLRSLNCQSDHWPWGMRGRLHRGYKLASLELFCRDDLRELVRNRPIKFYGHSLGGCFMQGLALALHDNGANVLSIETYGAPPMFVPGFKWPDEIKHTRYTCGHDIIPNLFPNYAHNVNAIHFETDTWKPIGILWDHRLKSYESVLTLQRSF